MMKSSLVWRKGNGLLAFRNYSNVVIIIKLMVYITNDSTSQRYRLFGIGSIPTIDS